MLTNGQTTGQVKDFKHIGWGISVRENNNDWAENFAKCNNGTKNSILAKQWMMKFNYNYMKYCTVWKLAVLCEGSAGFEANATKTDQIQRTCATSKTRGASPERIALRRKRLGTANTAEEIQSHQMDWPAKSGPNGELQVFEEIAGLWTYLPRPSQLPLGRSTER